MATLVFSPDFAPAVRRQPTKSPQVNSGPRRVHGSGVFGLSQGRARFRFQKPGRSITEGRKLDYDDLAFEEQSKRAAQTKVVSMIISLRDQIQPRGRDGCVATCVVAGLNALIAREFIHVVSDDREGDVHWFALGCFPAAHLVVAKFKKPVHSG